MHVHVHYSCSLLRTQAPRRACARALLRSLNLFLQCLHSNGSKSAKLALGCISQVLACLFRFPAYPNSLPQWGQKQSRGLFLLFICFCADMTTSRRGFGTSDVRCGIVKRGGVEESQLSFRECWRGVESEIKVTLCMIIHNLTHYFIRKRR